MSRFKHSESDWPEVVGSKSSVPKGSTIFEKDVLRTGTFKIGVRRFAVDSSVLHRLVTNFKTAKLRGIRIPVVWNHSRDARDKLGEITSLFVCDKTLRARFWATEPESIRKLERLQPEASVEVSEDWKDGLGRQYDLMVTHLAIVHLPVVPGQSKFKTLQLSHSHAGVPLMPDSPTVHTQHSTSPEVNQLFARAINRAFSKFDDWSDLQSDASVEESLEKLVAFVKDQSVIKESPQAELIAQLQRELESTTQQLQQERENALAQQKMRFAEAIDRLTSEGRLLPADKETLLMAAEPSGYQLSLLAPFTRIPAGSVLPLNPVTKSMANPKAPAVFTDRRMTNARAREIATSFKD